jgi:hypothetical protein
MTGGHLIHRYRRVELCPEPDSSMGAMWMRLLLSALLPCVGGHFSFGGE